MKFVSLDNFNFKNRRKSRAAKDKKQSRVGTKIHKKLSIVFLELYLDSSITNTNVYTKVC